MSAGKKYLISSLGNPYEKGRVFRPFFIKQVNEMTMKEILISTKDAARIWSCIEASKGKTQGLRVNLAPLINELNRAKKIKPESMPADIVTMNSIVSLMNLKTNKSIKVQIVYPDSADISKQKISIFAPIGTALLGYKKGDVVEWDTPSGKTEFKIEDIIYQPESEGRFDL